MTDKKPPLLKLVVLESPYGSDDEGVVERNILYARRALLDSLRRGEAPFASHLLYTQVGVLDDRLEADRAFGIAAGFAWGKKASVRVFYVDYGITDGMRMGLEEAQAIGQRTEMRSIGPNPEQP